MVVSDASPYTSLLDADRRQHRARNRKRCEQLFIPIQCFQFEELRSLALVTSLRECRLALPGQVPEEDVSIFPKAARRSGSPLALREYFEATSVTSGC